MKNVFDNMMGRIEPGLCRLTPNGKIAIKTSDDSYKSFDVKTERLTNCANFVFDIGEEFFFVMPTNKVKTGDIILVGGKPRCVISSNKNEIIVLNYENSTKECVIPERHMFLGKSYMYGKIVSPMSGIIKGNNMMKYMMMSEMMKGMKSQNTIGDITSNPMGLMMMSSMFGGDCDFFAGMFDEEGLIDVEDESEEQ